MLETRGEAKSDGNATNRRWNIRRFQNVGSQAPPAPRLLQVCRLALGEVSVRPGWAKGQPGEAPRTTSCYSVSFQESPIIWPTQGNRIQRAQSNTWEVLFLK